MSKSRTLVNRIRHGVGVAAVFALMPKCVLCLVGYAGFGGALGLRGPEICGAAGGVSDTRVWIWTVCGLVIGIIGMFAVMKRRQNVS